MARLLLFVCLIAAGAFADPPPGYYDPATGLSGAALKNALHGIIQNGHTPIPYNDLEMPLRALWQDPANASNILLIYSSASVPQTASTWNKEHLWPRSRGNSDASGPDDSDLHYVVPCDGDVNSQRGNLYFDNSSAADGGIIIPGHPEAPETSRDANSWEPPPAEKGDIARAIFYVAVRYDGAEPNTTDMEIVDGPPAGPQMARLRTLLAWHLADPPDAAERARNDRIFSTYQHNRNPFVDHPEYAESIFGGGSVPMVQALATDPGAVEAPASTGIWTIPLSPAAGAGGLVVSFGLSGTAQSADYTLSGAGVSFNASTRTGTIAFPSGASSANVVLTPAADGVPEPPETALLTLTPGAGYTVTGSAAAITLNDVPPAPPAGVIAAWNFDSPTSPTAPRYRNPLPADSGVASLRFDGWTGTIESFTGTNEECTINVGQALALADAVSNGRHIDLVFSSRGQGGLVVTFGVRGTATGFDVGAWSYSTDGSNFTILPGVNTASRNPFFERRSVDFTGIDAVRNAPAVTLRYILSGASSQLANNRIDNLTIRATPLAQINVTAPDPAADERGANPAIFTFTSNTPAGPNGMMVAFTLGGSADPEDDYQLSGAASFDPTTATGTILIPQNAATATLTITPRSDNRPTEFAENVIAQIFSGAGSHYTAGTNPAALATIADDTPYAAAWAARFPGFAGLPAADGDDDGILNLVECALDLNPRLPDVIDLPQISVRELPDPASGGALRPFAVISFVRRTDADAPRALPQHSPDLVTWMEDLVIVETQPAPNPTTERVTFRTPQPIGSGTMFLRVIVRALR